MNPYEKFVNTVADLLLEGEGGDTFGDDGFVWENDDAWETVQRLISDARAIVDPERGH